MVSCVDPVAKTSRVRLTGGTWIIFGVHGWNILIEMHSLRSNLRGQEQEQIQVSALVYVRLYI